VIRARARRWRERLPRRRGQGFRALDGAARGDRRLARRARRRGRRQRDGLLRRRARCAALAAPALLSLPDGFGTLGYALPAAIGAKLARPVDRVLALAGDGGVLFSVAELAAAAQERLALPVVVVDNSGYGEIRNEMRERGDAPLGVDFRRPGLRRPRSRLQLPRRDCDLAG
jgi:acetolactate synthase-1/2/3 large subunit